jgi:hypothetical protein
VRILLARLRRFLHCLFRCHRSLTLWDCPHFLMTGAVATRVVVKDVIACECGRVFYERVHELKEK